MDVPGIACDACTLLNIVATGKSEDVLKAYGCPCFIVKTVRESETLYLRSMPEEDPAQPIYRVDLMALADAGILIDEELTGVERDTYIAYAQEVDDGEAMTASLALHRSWWLATDDGKARRFCESKGIHLLRTSEWLKHWSESAGVPVVELREVLRRIELKARFRPNSKDPLYLWWSNIYQSTS